MLPTLVSIVKKNGVWYAIFIKVMGVVWHFMVMRVWVGWLLETINGEI